MLLVALLLAPILRKFGKFTIPDFLAEALSAVGAPAVDSGLGSRRSCARSSYLVAQIYGVGLITTQGSPAWTFVARHLPRAGAACCCVRSLGGHACRQPGRRWRSTSFLVIAYLRAGDLAVGQADRNSGAAAGHRSAARALSPSAKQQLLARPDRGSRSQALFKARCQRLRAQARRHPPRRWSRTAPRPGSCNSRELQGRAGAAGAIIQASDKALAVAAPHTDAQAGARPGAASSPRNQRCAPSPSLAWRRTGKQFRGRPRRHSCAAQGLRRLAPKLHRAGCSA